MNMNARRGKGREKYDRNAKWHKMLLFKQLQDALIGKTQIVRISGTGFAVCEAGLQAGYSRIFVSE